jgi:hypothetical protein
MSAASAAVLTDLTLRLDLAGVAANALLGAVKARERRLDLFGVAVVAIASGLAGGIIRDVLLQRGPPLGCWAATGAESAAGRRPGRRAAPAGLPPRARCPGPDSARYPCLHDPRSPRRQDPASGQRQRKDALMPPPRC